MSNVAWILFPDADFAFGCDEDDEDYHYQDYEPMGESDTTEEG